MKKIILLFTFIIFFISVYAQNRERFCKAAKEERFKKVERLIRRQVKKMPVDLSDKQKESNKLTLTMDQSVDSLTSWIKNMPCVEDAFWDKCQIKIAIYPGWAIIGVRFKTDRGIQEKYFSIQKGTNDSFCLFGWRPHLFKFKQRLVYKRMYDCAGFIEEQKRNCVNLK